MPTKFPEHEYLYPPVADSSRLLVGCSREDYSASRIAHAVEDCDAHLLNLNVTSFNSGYDADTYGENRPDVCAVALDAERFGADGITVHPRPDERHIRRDDVFRLRPLLRSEFNIEGYPDERLIDIVLQVRPTQVTLVPDAPGVLTSSAGWDVQANGEFLSALVEKFKEAGVRTSVFLYLL